MYEKELKVYEKELENRIIIQQVAQRDETIKHLEKSVQELGDELQEAKRRHLLPFIVDTIATIFTGIAFGLGYNLALVPSLAMAGWICIVVGVVFYILCECMKFTTPS